MPFAPALDPSVHGEGVAEGAAMLHWEGVVGTRAFPAVTGALAKSAAAAYGCVADRATAPRAHPPSWDTAPRGHVVRHVRLQNHTMPFAHPILLSVNFVHCL